MDLNKLDILKADGFRKPTQWATTHIDGSHYLVNLQADGTGEDQIVGNVDEAGRAVTHDGDYIGTVSGNLLLYAAE